jgi:hypothetical protein
MHFKMHEKFKKKFTYLSYLYTSKVALLIYPRRNVYPHCRRCRCRCVSCAARRLGGRSLGSLSRNSLRDTAGAVGFRTCAGECMRMGETSALGRWGEVRREACQATLIKSFFSAQLSSVVR